jgi:hypothetical protein
MNKNQDMNEKCANCPHSKQEHQGGGGDCQASGCNCTGFRKGMNQSGSSNSNSGQGKNSQNKSYNSETGESMDTNAM